MVTNVTKGTPWKYKELDTTDIDMSLKAVQITEKQQKQGQTYRQEGKNRNTKHKNKTEYELYENISQEDIFINFL